MKTGTGLAVAEPQTFIDESTAATSATLVAEPAPPVIVPEDLRLCDDGIFRLQLPTGVHINGDMARKVADQLRVLTAGRPVPMLLRLTGVGSVSRGARGVCKDADSVSACALVGESPVDRVIANFLLGGAAPKCPIQFFTSESEANLWLEGYVQAE